MKYNVLLVGVGGQGLMLLSQVMGDACTRSGVKVLVGAQHGLAQRSGSISAHVRIGDAYSPLIPYGSADLIIAMEATEALRYIEFLKPGGTVVMNSRIIHPPLETAPIVANRQEKRVYVTLEQVCEQLGKIAGRVIALDAEKVAAEAGNPRTENVVLLGAASALKGFPVKIEPLKESIGRVVPKSAVEANLKAFDLGRKAAED
ncbi:TPA: indolepyruvate oxidoreductase subunit beta [Candidatus Bathyarchaeota archaeon]|nr:indolepyruvate oxidoreductase subunit beta [Candidatus Bathyarchaeota archaeon]